MERPRTVRPSARRSTPRVVRSRVPLHRRPFADPSALRRWLLVGLLAVVTASITARVLAAAESERAAWGETTPVLVLDRPVRAGEALAPATSTARWPRRLVPDGAVVRLRPGAVAAGPLGAGTPLTDAAVTGDRLVSRVRLALALGDARLELRPGARVDVWATTDPSLSDGELSTRRVAAGAVVVEARRSSVVVAVRPGEVQAVARAAAVATVMLAETG